MSEAASQQILHRAKKHVAQGRARAEVDEAAARRVVEEFLVAATSGRTEPLVRLLTADAVAIGDGGGKVPARAKAFEGRSRSRRSCGACSSPVRPSAPCSAAPPGSMPPPPTATPPWWRWSTGRSSA